MFRDRYLDQVRLLIRCLPAVSEEQCFALKGGHLNQSVSARHAAHLRGYRSRLSSPEIAG